jgi:hypothetical protein
MKEHRGNIMPAKISYMLSIHSNISAVIARNLNRLHQIQPGGAAYDIALRSAADTQCSAMVQRIHVSGIAGDGSDIGQYSTSPIYVNPKNSPGSFEPVGKSGRTVFARTGQPHLTRYFDQGYKSYRDQIGLPSDKVVLTLRGDLRDGLTIMPTSEGYGLGWTDEALYDLSQALEAKYAKPIWSATEDEKASIVKGMQQQISEAMDN